MPLITDMNARERESFARKARDLSESSARLADVLEDVTKDDVTVLTELLMVSLGGGFLRDLIKIFEHAVMTNIPDNTAELDKE
jgi:hypothetical protein